MKGYSRIKIYGSADDSLVTVDELADYIGNSGGGQQGEKGDSAYQVAVNNGYVGTQDEWLDSLKGQDGERGKAGEDGKQGIQGVQGVEGKDGANFEVDGWVDSVAELPDATINQGKTYGTTALGHLHHSDGVQWNDWGAFTGVQGERGKQGIQGVEGEDGKDGKDGVFDIGSITEEQVEELHDKLTEFNEYQTWSYQSYLASGQSCRFQVADLNLDLTINRKDSTTIVYKFYPNDLNKEARYYVNRLSNYDLTAWESTVTLSYQAQVITASGFFLDQSGYLAGREQTLIQVIDPTTNIWYSIEFIGLGEGTMFIDVTKRVNKKRAIIPAT